MIIPVKKQCFIATYSYQLVQDFATIHSMMVEIMEIYDFNDQLDLIGLMLGYASLGSQTTLKNRIASQGKSSFNSKKWTFLWDI